MALKHIDHSSLDSTVNDSPLLVLDVWASWCGPCLRFAPVFEAVAQANPDVTFAKLQLDASDENQAVGARLGIQSIPSLLLFKDGHWVDLIAGALPKARLEAVVQKLRDFDLAAALEGEGA
ncbi:MAG: thioredoxin family protein [Propionibacteriaceae bacterium]|jgi:thioredoxin|nr:thioredoxin family protein [Propionibacteriaceae bacterium]